MKSVGLIIVVSLFYVLSQSPVGAQGFIFRNSQIITSENKQYVFVLLSNENIEQHIKRTLTGWKEVGFTKDELAKSKKLLVDEMQEESSIRQKFKVSGIFKNNSDLPIHIIKDFPPGLDSIFVANDGSYVVGLQSHIPFDRITSNTTREELLSTSKTALTSIVFNENNATYCNAGVIDFVNEKYPVSPATDGFFWAVKAYLDNGKNVLVIHTLNDEKISWDIKNCKIIENFPQQSSETKPDKENKQNSSCFSVAIMLTVIGYISPVICLLKDSR